MFRNKPIFKCIDEKRKNELEKIKKEKRIKYRGKYKNPPFSFSYPITNLVFKDIMKALINDARFKIFDNICYEVIDQEVCCSAKEMYRHIIMDINVKISMINSELHRFLSDKVEVFGQVSKSKKNLKTGQKEVKFNTEYWHILNDIELLIVLIRSVLDLMTQLTPMFFFDKNPPPNQSFTKQINWFYRRKQDLRLLGYFDENLDWFKRLREIRNDISHYGSLQLSFKEESDQIKLIVHTRKFDLLLGEIDIEREFIRIIEGFNCFIKFYEQHFLNQIKSAQK